jgi:hypothetical protein
MLVGGCAAGPMLWIGDALLGEFFMAYQQLTGGAPHAAYHRADILVHPPHGSHAVPTRRAHASPLHARCSVGHTTLTAELSACGAGQLMDARADEHLSAGHVHTSSPHTQDTHTGHTHRTHPGRTQWRARSRCFLCCALFALVRDGGGICAVVCCSCNSTAHLLQICPLLTLPTAARCVCVCAAVRVLQVHLHSRLLERRRDRAVPTDHQEPDVMVRCQDPHSARTATGIRCTLFSLMALLCMSCRREPPRHTQCTHTHSIQSGTPSPDAWRCTVRALQVGGQHAPPAAPPPLDHRPRGSGPRLSQPAHTPIAFRAHCTLTALAQPDLPLPLHSVLTAH